MALIIDVNKPEGDSVVAADNKTLNEDLFHLQVMLANTHWKNEEYKQRFTRIVQYLGELRAYRWAIKHAKEPEDVIEPLTIMADYYKDNSEYDYAAGILCAIDLIRETFNELFDTEYIGKEN